MSNLDHIDAALSHLPETIRREDVAALLKEALRRAFEQCERAVALAETLSDERNTLIDEANEYVRVQDVIYAHEQRRDQRSLPIRMAIKAAQQSADNDEE